MLRPAEIGASVARFMPPQSLCQRGCCDLRPDRPRRPDSGPPQSLCQRGCCDPCEVGLREPRRARHNLFVSADAATEAQAQPDRLRGPPQSLCQRGCCDRSEHERLRAAGPPQSLCQRGCCDPRTPRCKATTGCPATISLSARMLRHLELPQLEFAELRHNLFVSADAATAGARDH